MSFEEQIYKKKFNRLLAEKTAGKYFIKRSNDSYKTAKLIQKALESFDLAQYIWKSDEKARSQWTITICYYAMLYMAKAAILTRGYETDDHYATQIALGHLMISDELEREDLEFLEQSYKIFEEDYVEYFEEARKECSTSRYPPTKMYTDRRVKEIFTIARKFIKKLSIILEED